MADMLRKIEVAADSHSTAEFLIIARTDARSSLSLDEALRRAETYAKAAADILFVEAPESEAEMEQHAVPMPPNILDRQFAAIRQNQKWVADFTYVWTAEGWLYVAVVIGLFSRRVVGWSMSPSMTAQLVTDALVMAIWQADGSDPPFRPRPPV